MAVAVIVKSRSDLDKTTQTNVEVTELTSGSRMMRAVKGLAICWVIAIFCILVPILHFVLVPLFLLIGVVIFMQQWGQKFYFNSGSIECPSCKTMVTPEPGAFDWPKREICKGCRADLTIEPRSGP